MVALTAGTNFSCANDNLCATYHYTAAGNAAGDVAAEGYVSASGDTYAASDCLSRVLIQRSELVTLDKVAVTVVERDGSYYATIDLRANPEGTTVSSSTVSGSLPSDDWTLAEYDNTTVDVIAAYPWDADLMALAGNASYLDDNNNNLSGLCADGDALGAVYVTTAYYDTITGYPAYCAAQFGSDCAGLLATVFFQTDDAGFAYSNSHQKTGYGDAATHNPPIIHALPRSHDRTDHCVDGGAERGANKCTLEPTDEPTNRTANARAVASSLVRTNGLAVAFAQRASECVAVCRADGVSVGRAYQRADRCANRSVDRAAFGRA
ncbi:hypothetical protein CTAYLR_000739 [Chrysophaeum taylorii]|uniref:Uncharacterized protein n=1 Tax=Chrysophaeum taylorii TaxID=2483200 RepID=A0AAD7XGD6_9STRA|nr:hypothetical protein CTAYLR_000739 [Chrysophaeum taylorii]